MLLSFDTLIHAAEMSVGRILYFVRHSLERTPRLIDEKRGSQLYIDKPRRGMSDLGIIKTGTRFERKLFRTVSKEGHV